MADNVSGGLPNLGKTYHGGTPSSIGRSLELEGTVVQFRDETKSGYGPKTLNSGQYVSARLVRNSSGFALAPGRLVTWESGYRNRRVDGYAKVTSVECAGVVDPLIPATGVADDDLFWVIFKGPCLVKTAPNASAAANEFSIGDVVAALTAATSGVSCTTAGRPAVALTSGATTPQSMVILNRIGRAMSAMTSAQTDQNVLIDLNILS